MTKNIKITFFLIVSSFTISSCLISTKKDTKEDEKVNTIPTEDFKKKFAGSYTIEIKGKTFNEHAEVYALNENGGVSWLWIENKGKGNTNIDDRKVGTWTATENSITINIQGNTGVITESYELKDEVLVNSVLPKRYLKPVQ
ncbi:hypothetical protein [Spongiimicrobium salis]|uniref:hypothetical protein n=1 Tax=Spongiimicrobium salis TaxID=1667022 RepID=UPI00374DAF80